MIRVLHVVPNMQVGGLETFIMNIYKNIDRDKIQFDFLEHYKEESAYDEQIRSLGGNIYHFSLRNDNNIFRYIINLNKFFKEHKEYKIIHCHMESIGSLVFFIARFHGIKICIGHSHTTSANKNIKGFVKKMISKPFKFFTDYNFACSKEAGKYLFGKKEFEVISNAIDMKKFVFNKKIRNKLRKEFHLENSFVIGHVGRMDKGKNQLFLLDIFNSYQKVDPNSFLVLIGDGEDREKIVHKINNYGLNDKVLLLGIRKDVYELYSMFDMFVFPSLFEGLPLTLIEAEVNGLTCLASDNISKECIISDKIHFLDVNENALKWKDKIIEIKDTKREVVNFNDNKEKYNIVDLAKYLENKYIDLSK